MSNAIYDLKWGQELADRITPQVKRELGAIRARPQGSALDYPPLIPIVPLTSLGYDIQPARRPVKISSSFRLAQKHFSDELLAEQIALRAARNIASAEDAIILHGFKASPFLKDLNVQDENNTLSEQEGLFKTAPKPLPAQRLVTHSIVEGLESLEKDGRPDPSCVLLAHDLYQEAFSPLSPTSGTSRILPFLPLLRDKGFRFSLAAPSRTGVIFSLGVFKYVRIGDAPEDWRTEGAALEIGLSDAHVECRKVEADAVFAVVQEFRLQINEPSAVVTLV